MGPIVDGRYRLERPVPLSGGVGPYFTIRADVFEEIGGFEKCEFTADFEAMIGFKVWDAGYKCCLIPAPPAYHARGVGTRMAIGGNIEDGIFSDESEAYEPWTEKGKERFKEKWGFEAVTDAVKYYEQKYQNAATQLLADSRYIKYQSNKFPVNIEYDKLTDINLGSIHWRDEKQAKRMIWLAEHCTGSILDVGCASGGLINFLKGVEKAWSHYTGVDLDRVRIDEAIREHGGEPYGTSFYVIDVTYGLPFTSLSFDTVVCSDVLEHIPRKIGIKLVEELCAISRGQVLLTFPISKEFMKNDDHVWASILSEVQKFLEPVTSTHYIEIESTDDFALICLESKIK
jgi:SAM-dependent methyltransferase